MKTYGTLVLMAVLIVLPLAAKADEPSQNTSPGPDTVVSDPAITQVQVLLRAAGFDPGAVEGVYTARTVAAVRQFQAAKGLPVTGLLDDRTRAALLDNSPHMDQANHGPDQVSSIG